MNSAGYGGCISEPGAVKPPVVSVLYVDDEPILLNVCKSYLERRQEISVSIASSVEKALVLLESSSFDVIISDYQMPVMNGIDFLRILRNKQCSTPFILFTGKGREEIMVEALENGALFYIQKGGNPHSQFNELYGKVREACEIKKPGRPVHTSGRYYTTAQ